MGKLSFQVCQDGIAITIRRPRQVIFQHWLYYDVGKCIYSCGLSNSCIVCNFFFWRTIKLFHELIWNKKYLFFNIKKLYIEVLSNTRYLFKILKDMFEKNNSKCRVRIRIDRRKKITKELNYIQDCFLLFSFWK
jgi:hypothetical protein